MDMERRVERLERWSPPLSACERPPGLLTMPVAEWTEADLAALTEATCAAKLQGVARPLRWMTADDLLETQRRLLAMEEAHGRAATGRSA